MSDRSVLQGINVAFGTLERPRYFTHIWHCEECADHDDRLQLCDRHTLCLEDVGYAACDPFCVATPQALAYFFPSLARLALAPPSSEHGWYATQLLFHLAVDEIDNPFYRHCDTRQRAAVARLLAHVVETRAQLAIEEQATDNFVRCYRLWSAPLIGGRMIN